MEKLYYKKSEMIKLGYSEHLLKRIAHASGAPVLRTGAGGNYMYRLKDIDAFINELNKRDEEVRQKNIRYQRAKRQLKARRV